MQIENVASRPILTTSPAPIKPWYFTVSKPASSCKSCDGTGWISEKHPDGGTDSFRCPAFCDFSR